MSGPQVFFCGENGEVIHWDINDPPIKIGVPRCATLDGDYTIEHQTNADGFCMWPLSCKMCRGAVAGTDPRFLQPPVQGEPGVAGPIGCFDPPGPTGSCGYTTGPSEPEYCRGYQNALKDVLNEVMRSGKQNLVQWLEQQLKALT